MTTAITKKAPEPNFAIYYLWQNWLGNTGSAPKLGTALGIDNLSIKIQLG